MVDLVESRCINDDCYAVFEKLPGESGSDGKIVLRSATPCLCKMVGLPYPQCLNKPVQKQRLTEFYKRMAEAVDKALREIRCFQYVQKFVMEGEESYWLISVEAFRQSGRDMVGFRLNRVQDFWADYKEQFCGLLSCDALMEGSDEGILIARLNAAGECSVMAANSRLLSWLGRPFTAVTGKKLDTILPGEVMPLANALLEKCRRLRKPVQSLEEVYLKNKSRYYRIKISPLFLDDRTMLMVYIRDETDIMRQRQQLQELLDEYECYFQTTTNGVGMILISEDMQINVVRSNPSFDIFQDLYARYGSGEDRLTLLMETVNSGTPTHAQICLKIDNHSVFYSISIIPVHGEDAVKKLFINCVNTTETLRLSEKHMEKLTKRENEMLELVASGHTNRYIAYQLGIAEGTVKRTISNAYKKLNVTSRSELVKFFLSDVNIGII